MGGSGDTEGVHSSCHLRDSREAREEGAHWGREESGEGCRRLKAGPVPTGEHRCCGQSWRWEGWDGRRPQTPQETRSHMDTTAEASRGGSGEK